VNEPPPLQQIERTYARCEGRKFSYFSGCDYFRLASDPRVAKAIVEATQKHGISVSASRLTSGNHVLYQELERSLREFFDAPSAVLVPTGYQANIIAAQALAGQFSHALIDENSHPSIFDAAQFLECPVIRFKHRSVDEVDKAVLRCGSEAKLLLLTDGVFSTDGAIAPLAQYFRALQKDSWLFVDDAHAAGLLGASGKGSLEYARLPRRRIIQTVTLSKAFGTYGGAILGSVALRQRIIERSHVFTGSTPLPLPLASAALAAIEIVRKNGNTLRERLKENTAVVRNSLRLAGLCLEDSPAPILSITPRTSKEMFELNHCLLTARIYPPFIRYPGSSETGAFRFAISSEHRPSQLSDLVKAVKCFMAQQSTRAKTLNSRVNSFPPRGAGSTRVRV
jgi:7-keto-8-aminopelargonate synthetase-like enzyme